LTLSAMMMMLDVHPQDLVIGLEFPMPEGKVPEFLEEVRTQSYDIEQLALLVQDRMPTAKYDWLLGPELVSIQHARRHIDLESALRTLSEGP